MTEPFTCANCDRRQFHFESAVSCYSSRGLVRELIHRFKYRGEEHLRHVLAGWLSECLSDPRIADVSYDYLVPVPLHPVRKRERGFNQALVLARLLVPATGSRLVQCLRRDRYTSTQTILDREDRIRNLRGPLAGSRVLLVDDVLTTGSTVDECARTLKSAGVASIRVITVARA